MLLIYSSAAPPAAVLLPTNLAVVDAAHLVRMLLRNASPVLRRCLQKLQLSAVFMLAE